VFTNSPRLSKKLIFAVLVGAQFLVVPLVDAFYRRTLGKFVLTTRITHVIGDTMYTEFGKLSLLSILSDRWRANEFQMQVRLGCKYEMVISDGPGTKLLMYFGYSPGPLRFEYIVRGINEPALGCELLYDSTSLVKKKERYEIELPLVS
jgi:hypothetical protein